MILGHKKHIDAYIDNADLNRRMEECDIQLLMNRVESENLAIAGYLAGPMISEVTAYNLAEQISNSVVFQANHLSRVGIFEDFIALNQSSSK